MPGRKSKKSKSMTVPPPGLDGTYVGSCIVYLRGTDTGLAFSGPMEWAIAGLTVLGVPDEQAQFIAEQAMLSGEVTTTPGPRQEESVVVPVRVCRDCAAKSPAKFPVGLLSAAGVPVIACPDD